MNKFYLRAKSMLFLAALLVSGITGFSQGTVTIAGSGTAGSHLYNPFYTWYQAPRAFRSATIYSGSFLTPIPVGSTITSLEWYRIASSDGVSMPSGNNLKIYLQNTTQDNFGSAALTWDVSAATLVFNGDPSAFMGSSEGWRKLLLSAPFTYSGNNLIIYSEVMNNNSLGGSTSINWQYSTKAQQAGFADYQMKYTVNSSTTLPTSLSSSQSNHAHIKINFSSGTTCSGMPEGGTVTADKTTVCSGGSTNLTLKDYTVANGITIEWQSSATLNGAYASVSGTLTNPNFELFPPASGYYRAAVVCGSDTAFSDTVFIDVPPVLPANTYFIDNTKTTGGLFFNNFTDAINAINCGTTGTIIFKVAAGQTFTENVPAISISTNAQDSIVFIKDGSGANPKIIPASPGTITSSTTVGAHGDAIVKINGSDNITFDGVDVATNPSFTDAGMYEYGFLLTKNAGNASKNISIRNATISLNKNAMYSFGIYSSSNEANGSSSAVTSTDGRAENLSFINNTITNAYGGIQLRGFSSASPYDYYDQNNVIAGNNINNIGDSTSSVYGIYIIYQNNVSVVNNHLSNITSAGSVYGIYAGTSTNGSANITGNNLSLSARGTTSAFYGIYNTGGTSGTNNTVNISGNTLSNCTYPTATSASIYLIYHSATAYNLQIDSNVLSNNVFPGTGTTYLIYNASSIVNSASIYNNTISGFTKGGSSTVYGIYSSAASSGSTTTIGKNTVSNIHTAGGTLYGITLNSGDVANVFKNRIFGLSSGGAAGTVNALYIPSGAKTVNVYNNFISDLSNTEASSTTDATRGIYITNVTANAVLQVANNTVYLNSTSAAPSANYSSSALYHTYSATATSGNLTVTNNVFVNTSTPQGTGTVSAFRRSSATSTANLNSNSNNNIYYVGPPSANRVIYFDGTNKDQTVLDLQTRLAPAESFSKREMPPFVNISTAPYDLHIKTNVPTQLEGGGQVLLFVTDDIDGDDRDVSTPDIGADEFNGLPALPMSFSSANAIHPATKIYPSKPNQTILRVEVVTANAANPIALTTLNLSFNGTPVMTDISGATVSVYYTGPSPDFNANTLYGNGIPSATSFPVSGYQELTTGSNYFWLVLDNILPSTPAGTIVDAELVSVQIDGTTHTISNGAPAGNLVIVGPMAGHYLVAPNQAYPNFTSFSEAAQDLLWRGIADTVFIDAVSGTGPYKDQVVLKHYEGISANTPVYFNGNGVTITDSSTAVAAKKAVFALDSARHITISNFKIVTGGAAVGFGVQLYNDADNNTITGNTIVTDTSGSNTNFAGVVINTTASAASTTTGNSRSDNNLIANNTIFGGYAGVALTGQAANKIFGNKVTGNTISDFYTYGVYINGNDGAVVEANNISRPVRDAVTTFYGVYFTAQSLNTLVAKNRIHTPYGKNPAATTAAYGIDLVNCDASAGSENVLANNLVYNFQSEGIQNGILNNGSDYVSVYHNTISLDYQGSACSSCATRGIYEQTASTAGFTIVNNLINIERGGSGEKQMLYFTSTDATTMNIENNGYYVHPSVTNLTFARTASSTYNTFADWQTGGKDAAGVFTNPMFADAGTGDFKPLSVILDNIGQPTVIAEDINGDPRDPATPDPGAYEFTNITSGLNIGVETVTTPQISDNDCYTNSEVIKIRIRNASTNTLDLSVHPVTVTVQVSGPVSQTLSGSISSGILNFNDTVSVTMNTTVDMSAPGVYTFNAYSTLTGDVNNSNDTMPTLTRTKEALAGGVSIAAPAVFCGVGGTPSLTAQNVTGYSSLQWQESTSALSGYADIAGATSLDYTVGTPISQTMYYRLAASCGTNTVYAVQDTAVISNPQIVSVVKDSICGSGTAALEAYANNGETINWYSDAVGGSVLHTGNSFTTPVINNTTTYYAEPYFTGTPESVGAVEKGSTGTYTLEAGLLFNAHSDVRLKGVYIYPVGTGAGTVVIRLQNSGGAVLETLTFNTVGVAIGSVQKTFVPLNWNIPTGNDYFISMQSRTGLVASLVRDASSSIMGGPIASNPAMQLPGKITITNGRLGNSGTSTSYYYFYDWQLENGCTGVRVPVEAFVDVTPGCTTLPVNGVVLSGKMEDSRNILSWQTKTETHNKGFYVERSADGSSFAAIGFVNSAAANGNSHSALNYQFTDVTPLAGINYYRLKQTDADGKFAFSNTIVLRQNPTTLEMVKIYPNPVRSNLSVQIRMAEAKHVTMAITDAAGKTISMHKQLLNAGETKVEMNVSALARGAYFIKVFCNEGCLQATQSFIKY